MMITNKYNDHPKVQILMSRIDKIHMFFLTGLASAILTFDSTFIQSGLLSNRKFWIRMTFIGQKS